MKTKTAANSKKHSPSLSLCSGDGICSKHRVPYRWIKIPFSNMMSNRFIHEIHWWFVRAFV